MTKGMLNTLTTLVLAMVLAFALPALATTESGVKSCNSTSHVYLKSRWKTDTDLRLDYHGYTGGAWDYVWEDGNYGVWETDYLNTYASWVETGIIDSGIDWGDYEIYGAVLSTTYSWPGCEAN